MSEDVSAAGRRLAQARAGHHLAAPLPEALIADIAGAYAVQAAAVAAYAQPRVGWKLGATGTVAQQRLGLTAPFHAPLFADGSAPSGATLPAPPGLRGVEVELAFKLAQNLPARPGGYRPDALRGAVASLHPALEVVAAREDRRELEGRHAIADFGLNAAFVYGEAIADGLALELPKVTARCLVDGESRAEGAASAVLGDPWLALAWLTEQGVALAAGDWVSTGTLTGITPAGAGRAVTGDFGQLGRVSLRFA